MNLAEVNTVPDELNHIKYGREDALREAMTKSAGGKPTGKRDYKPLDKHAARQYRDLRGIFAEGRVSTRDVASHIRITVPAARGRLEKYARAGLIDTEIVKKTRYWWVI